MKTWSRRAPFLLTVVLILPLLLSAVPPLYAAQQVVVKRNHDLDEGQRVLDFKVSVDGTRLVYRVARTLPPAQDNPPPPPADLYSLPAAGGVAVQLNPPAVNETESVESYYISPDGSEVIYLRTISDATGNSFELFRVPIDGATAALSVSGAIPVGARSLRDFSFIVDPSTIQPAFGDGSVRAISFSIRHARVPERISSITDGTSNTFFFGQHTNNLLQSPYSGGVRQLNPELTSGGVVYDFQITPDGTRAIYRADQNLDGSIELFSVPADGSDTGFRISGPLVAGGDVLAFGVNASSTRAVYLADQTTNGVVELYSARTNGGIVAKLNAPLAAGGAVVDFAFSPDGSLVAYLADALADEQFDLFAVASSESATSLLSRGLSGRSVRSFAISPDGAAIFFVEQSMVTGELTLFRQDLALGAGAPEAVPGLPVANVAEPDLKFSPDGAYLVYLADSGNDGIFELATVDLANAISTTAPINAPLVAGGNIRAFQISPDSSRVVYAADGVTAGTVELFTAAIDGDAVDRLSGPLVSGGNVSTGDFDFAFSPDGQIVYYLADAETDTVTELFAVFAAPELLFTQGGYVVAEDGSLATQLAVRRAGLVAAPASVRVQLTGHPDGGTAIGGSSLGGVGVDFVDNVRDVFFAVGEIAKTFTIAVRDDGIPEPAEDFTMQLFEPVGAVLGAEEIAKVTILDGAGSPLLDDLTFSLPENSANGTALQPLAAATAGSMAATAATTYTILAGNTNGAFRIDDDGALFVDNSAALDYETTPLFALLVEAQADNGSSDVATWQVALLNVNEAPVLANQIRSVAENSANGRTVGMPLAAIDVDGDPISFTLSSQIFAISAGGSITVKDGSKLDFETQSQYRLNVRVADSQGLSTTASVRINVLDVAEPDPTAPVIEQLSPASAVAGGQGFKLIVAGKNFTESSILHWNGVDRKTVSDGNSLIALIPASDIAATTTAKIAVVDAKSGHSSEAVPFAVTQGKVGIAELLIDEGDAMGGPAGQPTRFRLGWTHTSQPWRAMDEMDLRLSDGEHIPLWVRYQETRDETGNDISSIFLLNADGTPAGHGRFGETTVLENSTVRLDLATAEFMAGEEGDSSIYVQFEVVFKAAAIQDAPYTVEMYGVDDLGEEQGPNLMGEWQITSPPLYVPVVAK